MSKPMNDSIPNTGSRHNVPSGLEPKTPSETVALTEQIVHEMIKDALSTPSGDNCQPWKFSWSHQTLKIHHSETLAVHSLNRQNHSSLITLGTVLECLKISAAKFGYHASAKLILDDSGSLPVWAEVQFRDGNQEFDSLAYVIHERTTDRSLYKNQPLDPILLEKLQDLQHVYPGCSLHIQQKHSQKFLNYLLKTEELLWKNKNIVRDLAKWCRLTKKEVAKSDDGMSWRNMGLNYMEALIFRLIRKFPILPKLLWSFGFGLKIKKDCRNSVKASGALICISMVDTDPESYCQAGMLAYRVWLLLNFYGYAVQPMSFSSTSVADLISGVMPKISNKEQRTFSDGKEVLQENFNMDENQIPVWMFRTGLPKKAMTAARRTPRRRVEHVLMAKNYEGLFNYDQAFSRNRGWLNAADQEKLRTCRVAIAGLGGVGGAHLLSLVRLGVTKFHIADFDKFSIENINRQVGANTSTFGLAKIEIMLQQALLINPEIEITPFSEGVHSENLDQFLKDVDVYVDGLDAFVLNVRAEVFKACHEKGIPAVTVAPIGMGAALLTFLPGQMTFERYFGFQKAKNETEKIGRFVLGLAPSGLHVKAIADRDGFDLAQKKSGSTIMGCSLATGVLGTEVLKIILKKEKILAAPFGQHFDAFRNKYKRTWMPFGSSNPFFMLKLAIFKRLYMKAVNRLQDREPRIPVAFSAALEGHEPVQVRNVSKNGLCIESLMPQPPSGPFTLRVQKKNGETSQFDLSVKVVWHKKSDSGKSQAGLQILEASDEWKSMVDSLI